MTPLTATRRRKRHDRKSAGSLCDAPDSATWRATWSSAKD